MQAVKSMFLGLAVTLAVAGAAPAATTAPYDGPRKTIAVDTVQAAESVGGTVTADGMTALLIDALSRDPRFVVVERPGLASVQAEQQLDGVQAGTGAASGALIGASVIVRATVTKYEPAASGGGVSIGGPMSSLLAGRAAAKTQRSLMEITLRLVDTTTGQVVSSYRAQGFASASSAEAGVVNPFSGATAGANVFRATPIGQAGQDAIDKALVQIAAGMNAVPWSAQVVQVTGERVYVNAGADRNMQSGTVLNVYRRGQVLTDPSTGVVLDVELERVGTVRIDSVRDRLSTAVVVSGEPPARGDLLKLD